MKKFQISWDTEPAPGVTYYKGTETVSVNDGSPETAEERCRQLVRRKMCFDRGHVIRIRSVEAVPNA